MKKSLALFITLSFIAPKVLADAHDEDFAKHKAEILSHLNERTQKLAEHKACVEAAADKEALKKCRESMKDWHEGEKKERLERKKDHLKKRLEKLESEMKK